MSRKIYFINSPKTLFSGGSIIRSNQLNHIFNLFNKNHYTSSSLSTEKNFKNSVLIFNKYAIDELREDEITSLKTQGNILIADPLDGVIKDEILSRFDVIFACSILQKKDYQVRFSNRVEYVGHHVDLRIDKIKPEKITFNIGYFGELTNARYKNELSGQVDFVSVDTSSGNNVDWMSSLKKYNAHYAIRSGILPNQFKPFTKGFIAAYVECPVLLASDDLEAKNFVGANYPYFTDSNSIAEVQNDIQRMCDEFGGSNWICAMKAMREVKEMSSTETIASQLFEALKPEITNLIKF